MINLSRALISIFVLFSTISHAAVVSDWFKIEHFKNTYIIEEPKSSQGNVSYLIVGDNKAIMFDTGSGENKPQNGTKIKHVIDQITNFPVTLLLSHFHFDHSQNISEFSKIAFPDLPILKQRVSKGNIFKFTAEDLFIGSYPSQVKINKWLPVNSDIDLGNRVIQIISIPGHATESIGIIDKTNKMAFLGDYLYNGELFLFNNDDLKKYLESVNYLISILDADYKLFGAHGNAKVEFEKLLNLKTFLECINSGKCQGRSTILFGYDVKVYEHLEMHIVIFQLPNFQS